MEQITHQLNKINILPLCNYCGIDISHETNNKCCTRWCHKCIDTMNDTSKCILCGFKECYMCEFMFVGLCDNCGFYFCKKCCNFYKGHTGNSPYTLCQKCKQI